MGDAADDLYDAALAEEDRRWARWNAERIRLAAKELNEARREVRAAQHRLKDA